MFFLVRKKRERIWVLNRKFTSGFRRPNPQKKGQNKHFGNIIGASGLGVTITNEHIFVLPLQNGEHASTTTTWAYECRQITRVLREEQHDLNFLKDSYWPQFSDDIDFRTREHFNNLQKQNIATRDLQLQEPQDEEDIEHPPGVRNPIIRHDPQAVAPPQEQHPLAQQIQPPPGLPQSSQALLPRAPMVKQQAAPLAAPLLQGTSEGTGCSSTSRTSSSTLSSRKALQPSLWTTTTSTTSSQHH